MPSGNRISRKGPPPDGIIHTKDGHHDSRTIHIIFASFRRELIDLKF